MCVARIVLQQWREDFQRILNRAEIEEKLSRIYVDDNRTVLSYLREGMRFNERVGVFEFKERWKKEDSERDKVSRTLEEIGKAMNYVNDDLKFTIERESDFENGRLPTLAFEIWSTKEGIRHSYYEKGMRSQILTQKRSSQAENSKFSILTNELARRFEMLDSKIDTEEKTSIVDHFTQQLWNSGYSWQQIREVIVSSVKGFERKELLKREKKIERYRTSEMSLQSRINKKLIEPTNWYKKKIEEGEENISNEEKINMDIQSQGWTERKKAEEGGSLKLIRRKKKKRGVVRSKEYYSYHILKTQN